MASAFAGQGVCGDDVRGVGGKWEDFECRLHGYPSCMGKLGIAHPIQMVDA